MGGTDDLEGSNTRSLTLATASKAAKISEAMKDKAWIDCITEAINNTNKNQKVVPNNASRIGKFMILPHNFSEEGGELTPTKKLKRAVVEKKYAKQIEHMYASDGTYVEWIN